MKSSDPRKGTASAKLLGIVKQLASEARAAKVEHPTLDMSLERDLGFDSLTRVELMLRVERAFDVHLPEALLGEAETLRDILDALGKQQLPVHEIAEVPEAEHEVSGFPSDAQTLTEVLEWHVLRHRDRTHILFEESGNTVSISYGELERRAKWVAAGLIMRGVQKGEAVALMLPTGPDYFFSFFGILMAGCIPVPIYPPFRLSQMADHLKRHVGILSNAGAVMLVTFDEAASLARLLGLQVESLREVVLPRDLSAQGIEVVPVLQGEDIALLQYTSGSTGNPKGVVLDHANLLANIRAMGEAAEVDSNDVFVSWLPLYHDMGLIGAWFGSLYHACRYVVMSPISFLSRPSRWFSSISRHRGTLTASPNFGYALCLSRIEAEDMQGIDLSSLRMAFNGAEPVSPEVIRGFSEKFSQYGLNPSAISPVYGLAESSVGLAFPPPGRGAKVDEVDRDLFARTGMAIQGGTDTIAFVSCGLPLPGHEIRIVDAAGREVGERQEGTLEFRGPSATRGYFRNPGETEKLFHDAWLDSGDYAYIADGEIYVTGRAKDLIIRAGRNIQPYEAEEAVGNLPGIRRGCVAVFGVPKGGTEQLVVMAETKQREAQDELKDLINDAVVDVLGEPPDDILLVPPHTVLKTSSGKIRRTASRALYLGGLKRKRMHYLDFLAEGLLPQARRLARSMGGLLFAAYVWIVFWAIAPLAWIFAVSSKSRAWSWSSSRCFARVFLSVCGYRLNVEGMQNLQGDPAILVANHASYADGIVMAAALPGSLAPDGFFSFVAKKELLDSFISRLFLSHVGSEFVARGEIGPDIERIEDMARSGRSMIFFPEGTFTRIPGLAEFRMGAFLASTNAGIPVVPVALRGTRSALRDGGWLPRRGELKVWIGVPIPPKGTGWESAIHLRDEARNQILSHCGEPGLFFGLGHKKGR
jgi:acyl carrier protein